MSNEDDGIFLPYGVMTPYPSLTPEEIEAQRLEQEERRRVMAEAAERDPLNLEGGNSIRRW